jgi:hypothetical protein
MGKTQIDPMQHLEARLASLQVDYDRLVAEQQAVLDCINLYGDKTLHAALDAAGLLPQGDGEETNG